jgi:hypothetical protein
MNAILAVIKMHDRDKLLWFFGPWFLQLTAFTVTLVLGLLFHSYNTGFSSGGAGDIYLAYFVVGILNINDTFPFALSFSVRRKDYVLGTLSLAILLFAVTALALVTLGVIESHMTDGWGVSMQFFAPPYLSAGSFLQQWWVDFSLLIYLFSLGFAIGSIYRRFGRVGMLIFLAFAITLLFIWIYLMTYLNRWGAFSAWFGQHTAFELTLWLLPLPACCLPAAYLLLRRAVA